jgi:hypothetical protein
MVHYLALVLIGAGINPCKIQDSIFKQITVVDYKSCGHPMTFATGVRI